MNYAVIPLAGTQFLVSEGDELQVNRVSQEEGETFSIVPFLVSKDKALEVGMPETDQYQVSLTVVEHTKGEKLYVRRFKSKSRYRKKTGHRQAISVLRVQEITKKGGKSKRSEASEEGKQTSRHSGARPEDATIESRSEGANGKEDLKLSDLGLSTRTKNALKEAGKTDILELKKMSKEELKEIPGIGEKSADEILAKLK